MGRFAFPSRNPVRHRRCVATGSVALACACLWAGNVRILVARGIGRMTLRLIYSSDNRTGLRPDSNAAQDSCGRRRSSLRAGVSPAEVQRLSRRTFSPVEQRARDRLAPTAALLGIRVGGWHDFRHTLKRQMRRANVNPVVVRDTLGHSKVEQQEVYDEARRSEVGDALKLVGKSLLQNVLQNPTVQ
jgi:integrase